MRKLFLITASVAGMLFGIISGTTTLFKQESESTNYLALANIEAISSGESSSREVNCYCKPSVYGAGICSAMSNSPYYCGGDPCDSHDSNCR